MAFSEITRNTIASGINLKAIDFTIPNGVDTSDSKLLWGTSPLKIIIPAGFVGTQIFFEISQDNINFGNYYNAQGNPIFAVAAADRVIGLAPIDLLGIKYLRLRSDANETGITVTLVTMDVK